MPSNATGNAVYPLTELTPTELDALGAATYYARWNGQLSSPETAYVSHLPNARRDICHRFVGGVLRGAPAGLSDPIYLTELSALELAPEIADIVDEAELLVRLQTLLSNEQTIALLPFSASKVVLVVQIEATHGYDRYRLRSVAIYTPGRGLDEVKHPKDVVRLVRREGAFIDEQQADRIEAEIDESVANLALARLAGQLNGRRVAEEVQDSSIDELSKKFPAADPAAALERLVIEGHPFHPSAKIRRGMSPAESLAYAPEFADTIALRFAAVHTDCALETQVDTNESLTQQLYRMFDGLDASVERALPAERDRDEYAIIPLHPWQFYHTIPDRYRQQLRDRRVVLVDYSHPVTPLLNLRTTVPYETERTADGPLSHLKLAIGVQTTNVVRTLSPQAVANGPQVTTVLRAIHERESFDTLGFLNESAAACYHAPGGPHPKGEQFDDARHLSALIRMNPYEHPIVPEGAVPVVVSSLLATSPVTDQPLICDCIAEYANRMDMTTMATATERFLREYVAVVVPEQLQLLSEYGIALESHPQNSYIVLNRGRPVAMLVRDFGGIRVHDARLETHGLSLDPYPDSDLDIDSRDELYGKLYYALFNNHLAELIATLVQYTGVDEATCWGIVRSETKKAFAALRSRAVAPAKRIDSDERALFANPTIHKALTAMRLQGKRHEYVTSHVPNPLANASSQSVSSLRQYARD